MVVKNLAESPGMRRAQIIDRGPAGGVDGDMTRSLELNALLGVGLSLALFSSED